MSSDGPFTVELKNEKTKVYTRLGLAFVAMNLVTFMMFLFISRLSVTGIIGITAIILYFLIKYFEAKKRPLKKNPDDYIFLILAVVWVNTSYLVAIFLFLTGLLFKVSMQPFKFVFNRKGVYKDFFPRKEFEWNEIESVILKDGLLTINFKNDRMIQGDTEGAENLNEAEFNQFVNNYLSQN